MRRWGCRTLRRSCRAERARSRMRMAGQVCPACSFSAAFLVCADEAGVIHLLRMKKRNLSSPFAIVFVFVWSFFGAALCGGGLRAQAQSAPPVTAPEQQVAVETMAADTPKTTVAGNTFIAPKDWKLRVKTPATILEAPEGGSYVALVDVTASDAD